ncbi:Lrp/AsnC family transcriptional regulator, partial [uncultured Duncaniella sp.]
MKSTYTLDTTDLRILSALQNNSRLTVKELASAIHLSPTPTFERVKRLERDGYITKY